MENVIAFPAERCSVGTVQEGRDAASVIILPVIRVERHQASGEAPSDTFEPSTSSPRGKRRKR